MDINQIKCFVSVARTLNFSEAARRNYVSQSTVSRYISDLEKEFGVKLFTRSHRDVILTSEGKALLPYAVEMINALNKSKTVIKQMHNGTTGKISIGCDISSVDFPSQCISAFSKAYPDITVELGQIDVSEHGDIVTEGGFDFCFMPRDMVPESSGIESIVTHREPLVIAAEKGVLSKGAQLSSLAQIRLLLLSEECAPILYMEVIDLLRTFHVSPPSDSHYSDLSSLHTAISSGLGAAVLPKSLAKLVAGGAGLYEIDAADTSVAYVMAWSKSNSNPISRLFEQTARGLAVADDNEYGL